MPDIRVTLDDKTHGELRMIAFAQKITLRELVTRLLTRATSAKGGK